MRLSAPFTTSMVLAGALLSTACGGGGEQGLIARLRLDPPGPVYSLGEPIRLRLEITNHTDGTVVIQYPSDARYDFHASLVPPEALDYVEGIWAWSADNKYPDFTTEEIWDKGETVTYEGIWRQIDGDGFQVLPGQYVLEARNAACHTGVTFHCDSTANVDIDIRPD